MRSVLTRLGFILAGEKATIPSWRDDVLGNADLAEEVIRMYGYDTIESTLMCARTTEGKRTPKQKFELELEHALIGMGLSEIETFSFISPKYYDKICRPADDPLRRSIVIRNPLGEDTSVMRTTALPSMRCLRETITSTTRISAFTKWRRSIFPRMIRTLCRTSRHLLR